MRCPIRQQTVSGESGQNCDGHERKGGHSELVACGPDKRGGAKVPDELKKLSF
ncbi:hypothetical protein GCM10023149_15330 [Mucilaginibacter gynuensis]|uniref:Uncharacterized protein n=1 Tax=Mucilaginibacter gynuensis TaxID=1302236 RepID=A0ABP8G5Q6_9SPHI